jgi:hypothetical protein
MLRVLVDLAHRAGLDQNALLHHHDTVRNLGNDAEIMRNNEDRHSGLPLQLLEKCQHFGLHGNIERGRRLVSDQEVWAQRKRHGDHHALTLTAGKLVRIFVERMIRVGNAHTSEKPQRLGLRLGSIRAVRREGLPDLPADGVDRIEVAERILEDHRNVATVDLASLRQRHRQQVHAVEQDLARGNATRRHIDQVHDCRRRHRLARSTFAEDSQRLAATEVVGHVADGLDDTDRRVELDGEVSDFEQMVSHSCPLSFPDASAAPDRARFASSWREGSVTSS